MQQTNMIEIKHLQKKFGKFEALKDINFELGTGEVLGFIGPNGAGKSTTIRTILGLIKASAGSVSVFGKDAWTDAVAIHRQLAYVPGDVYLWPNLTGGQTIDMLLHMSQQKHSQRTDQLIKAFALDTGKKNRTYSKGNRQKVALIAALSTDVPLYIFDEPTSGLDPLNEVIFQEQVHALKAQGKSILLSSHILSEVEKMGDRIVIIRAGEIIESGSLDSMRHLTRSQVSVETTQPLAQLTQIAGVHQVTFGNATQTKAEFGADTEALNTIMTYLAQQHIVTLKTTPPTLEDMFLRYYDAKDTQKAGVDL
ncbi:ABC superfamily ATP binding cassette transporter ABC protein [Agrilactobacillus composti DSM 18527 = JCM 14202]|uniref:ABC superfamily ATP binding cassette transporter ABC protein n=1 Tax=Agrilactobacillus composti DSM 18527 = JCM 14202 TaxID=1423734 RepID=X0PSN0_9LACO|nr:ABC transporter ATP-binding protein [Agrilactobacillus composti]KRM35121.1 ABC superfamily ATP binding cassette transporter ABC protein [Agrilactobacillus composti DSM 18527 = JCM 14202]GAF40256.1 ABC transporter, ATP-binding protein [Agrilactobacillus composti DSM 18527 = JCM 14202]